MDQQRLHRTVPEARADQTTTSDPADQIIPAIFARCSTGAIATISFLSDIQSRRGALPQRPSLAHLQVNGAWCRNAKGADGCQSLLVLLLSLP